MMARSQGNIAVEWHMLPTHHNLAFGSHPRANKLAGMIKKHYYAKFLKLLILQNAVLRKSI